MRRISHGTERVGDESNLRLAPINKINIKQKSSNRCWNCMCSHNTTVLLRKTPGGGGGAKGVSGGEQVLYIHACGLHDTQTRKRHEGNGAENLLVFPHSIYRRSLQVTLPRTMEEE